MRVYPKYNMLVLNAAPFNSYFLPLLHESTGVPEPQTPGRFPTFCCPQPSLAWPSLTDWE